MVAGDAELVRSWFADIGGKLDAAGLAAFAIEDLGPTTVPEDFARNPRIHSCFVLRARA